MSTTPHAGVSSLDYRSPATRDRKRPNWFLRVGLSLGVLVGASVVLMPSMCKSRETANRAKCTSNLHQIGLAISMYADDHAGMYPDSFATILRNEQVTAALFTCPSSNDEAADGATPEAIITNMSKPHHCSYVYLGKGLTQSTVKDDTLVCYESPENHQEDGMNLLFGDGHAEWFTKTKANELITKATGNPATQP